MAVGPEQKLARTMGDRMSGDFNGPMFGVHVTELSLRQQYAIFDGFLEMISYMSDRYDQGLMNEYNMDLYTNARRIQDTIETFDI